MSDLETISKLAKAVEKKREELTTAEEELSKAVDSHKAKLDEVLAGVRPRAVSGAGGPRVKRGERQAHIRSLRDAGKTPEQISADSGYSMTIVKEVLNALAAKEGRPAAPPSPTSPSSLQPPSSPPSPPSLGSAGGQASDDDDGEPSAPSTARLVAAAKRGKNSKTGVARLLMKPTVGKDSHSHIAEVDEKGHGYTTPGKSGHTHRIVGFSCGSGPDGHKHELQAVSAD